MKTKIIKIEKEKYICEICNKEFDYESSCIRHENSHGLGVIEIGTRYSPYDGSEYSILIYNGEEYDSLDDFVAESKIDFKGQALKIVDN